MSELVGKARRLRRMTSEHGQFMILALDHRDSFHAYLSLPSHVDRDRHVDMLKSRLVAAVGRRASGVLLDPGGSTERVVNDGALHPDVGMMISLDAGDYDGTNQDGPIVSTEWSVQDVSALGGDAVKLLVYHRVDAPDAARREHEVSRLAERCSRAGVPLLVEPIPYDLPGRRPADGPDMIAASARAMAAAGADVLKLPFPTVGSEGPVAACARITTAVAPVPWVLLSWGASFPAFTEQLEHALGAGARGFAAGRSIWGDAVANPDDPLRLVEAQERFDRCVGITAAHARTALLPPPRDVVPVGEPSARGGGEHAG